MHPPPGRSLPNGSAVGEETANSYAVGVFTGKSVEGRCSPGIGVAMATKSPAEREIQRHKSNGLTLISG